MIEVLEDPASPTSNIFITQKERDDRLASGEIVAVAPKTFRKNRTAKFSIKGFSAKYGDYLEKLRYDKDPVGQLMLSEIKRRPMEAST